MKYITISTALITALVANTAFAGNGHRFDTAKVMHVEPITKTIQHRSPQRECWTETVAVENPTYGHSNHRSSTGTLLGALIGGAIGNKIGGKKKSRKRVGTIAGALLGGSIGRDASRKHEQQRGSTVTEYREVERCNVTQSVDYEERVIGYDVSYKYHGEIYNTRMDRHPGKRIKVKVNVRPVY